MLTYSTVFYCVNEGKPMNAGDSITSKDEKPANMLLKKPVEQHRLEEGSETCKSDTSQDHKSG
ncbi:hypothetical protein MNV_2040002 [Candidatus Methanoperedens nitroreducens]|uniref:Uncharacterized protein n=1 Tax=Candidatus Methanoperedens nitratireducens TaxID=1392998 RepID=A0A284VNQ6_9EURY|nr:hypothetical protein MNV_2040002 [Candidatus Methanoperedens nitroreducens]